MYESFENIEARRYVRLRLYKLQVANAGDHFMTITPVCRARACV